MKPDGAIVSIYVDLRATVNPGDIIRTATGRSYLVLAARRQTRGKRRGRQHLRAVVNGRSPDVSSTVHEIRWYKRGRART